jgi:hypothetical protein
MGVFYNFTKQKCSNFEGGIVVVFEAQNILRGLWKILGALAVLFLQGTA